MRTEYINLLEAKFTNCIRKGKTRAAKVYKRRLQRAVRAMNRN